MKAAVLAISFLLLTLKLHGEIALGDSLEWLTDSCPNIGIYVVTESEKKPYAFDLTFRLDTRLKGTPPETCRSSYSLPDPGTEEIVYVQSLLHGAPIPDVAVGARFLLFSGGTDPDQNGAYLINLGAPQFGSSHSKAIDCRFRVLSKEAPILAVVRARLKAHPPAAPGKTPRAPASVDVRVDAGAPAYHALYRDSDVYLRVPADLAPAKRDR